jgi:NADPH:quinone reductase-like Zn-dependent oxidoreductase
MNAFRLNGFGVLGGQPTALSVEIDQTYPLDEYAKALNHAEQYQRSGKVLFSLGH